MRLSLSRSIASSAVLISIGAPLAYAAEADSTTGALEEIVVTTQKRSENVQSVPLTVTAFTAAQIEKTQQRDLTDLTGSVPNFQISTSGSGPNASDISLRGLSFQDIEKSFEPPIGLFIDGVFLSTSTGQVAQTFDFDRIEVAAGPQGTLFGKNTTGGIINITRTKPNPDDEGISGKVRLTGGNFGQHDGEAVVTATLIPGVLAIKGAAFSQNNDGPYEAPYQPSGHTGARSYQAFSFATDWRPVENADVYLTYDHTNDHSQLIPQISALTPNTIVLPVGNGTLIDGNDVPCVATPSLCVNPTGKQPDGVTTSNTPNNAGYILNALTLNASYQFDDFKLISVNVYRYSTEASKNDYDATNLYLFETNRPESFRQFSEELRFESDFKGPFNFVAGLYYFNSGYTLVQHSFLDFSEVVPGLPPGLPGLNTYFGQYTHQSSQTEAAFVQANYDVTDQFRIILGARQSWDQKRILFALSSDPATADLSPQGVNFSPVTTRQHGWAQFTPKVSLEYKWTPDLMTYFTYSKGYNAGGFNGRAGSIEVLGPYAPEQVHSFELGVKSSWFGNRLRVNADVFHMDFNNAQEDIIVAFPVAPFTSTSVENAASIAYDGAELSVIGKPLPNWTIDTTFGYLNARYESFEAQLLIPPGQAPGIVVPTDNTVLKVRRTPPFSVGFNSDYTIPLEKGELGFNFNLRFTDQQELDLLNDPRGHQDAVTKVDASIRYNIDVAGASWTLSVWGKNLTDEWPKAAFVTGYQGSFVEFWGEEVGRTYGATLDVKF